MAVNITKVQKGGNVNLTKGTSMKRALVGLGWDPRTTDGKEFDLDASAIICGADGKCLSDNHFVFFNNPTDPSGAVQHMGDNRTGEGEGDDEQIIIDFTKMPAEVAKVVIVVSIYEAEQRGQNFGQVSNSFARVVDADNEAGSDETRFDLGEDFSTERSVVFTEIYKNGDDWKFRAVGQGYSSGLEGIIRDYGLSAG